VNVIPALPSLEYLLDSKKPKDVLQQIELACLDQAAQHLKRAKAEEEEARKYAAKADAARWLIDHLPGMVETVKRMIDVQAVLTFPEKAAEPEEVKWRPRWAG
jgi:glucuronate isomerase